MAADRHVEFQYFKRGPRILNQHFTIDPNEFVLWNLSYSMHGEDLMLRSMLKGELKSGLAGFYVDVGSHDCRYGSNSYLFYRYGWRGVCVEPNPKYASQYPVIRPRDVFLNAAVGEEGPGYWARFKISDAASRVGRSREEFGPDYDEPIKLSFLPLKTIFDQHVPPGTAIDFMNLDVEGNELSALKSNDWNQYRPKIIMVEVNNLDSIPIDASNFNLSEPLSYLRGVGYRVVSVAFPNAILVEE